MYIDTESGVRSSKNSSRCELQNVDNITTSMLNHCQKPTTQHKVIGLGD
jgi:hypothetical protein